MSGLVTPNCGPIVRTLEVRWPYAWTIQRLREHDQPEGRLKWTAQDARTWLSPVPRYAASLSPTFGFGRVPEVAVSVHAYGHLTLEGVLTMGTDSSRQGLTLRVPSRGSGCRRPEDVARRRTGLGSSRTSLP